MKYLYFSLYEFYKKIIKIEYWGDTPSHYCNIVLALFETMMLFSVIDYVLLLNYKESQISYSPLIPFSIAMFLFFFNKKYFKNKEAKIIKELSSKSKKDKIVIFFISFVILAFIVFFYFHTGTLIRDHNVSD